MINLNTVPIWAAERKQMVLEESVELEDMKTAVQNSIRKLNLPGSCGKDEKNGGKNWRQKSRKGVIQMGLLEQGILMYLAFLAPQSQESFTDTTIKNQENSLPRALMLLGKNLGVLSDYSF